MSEARISQEPPLGDRQTVPGGAPGGLPPIVMVAPRPTRSRRAIAIGFAMGRARLLRRPTALAALLGASLVVAAGVIERRVGSAGAADRALAATFRLVIPLVCFAIAAEAAGRGNLRDGVGPASRSGVARRDVALGALAAALALAATTSAALAALAVLVAGGGGALPGPRDAFTSAWIAALTASAYVGWFGLGATFGRRGGGRWAVLLADFALGGFAGFVGAVLPRAHAQNLLGGAAPLGLAQASSSALLGAAALVLCVLAALRCRE